MENNPYSQYIQAVAVNHNTSKYMELMLRSLFAKHPASVNISMTIYDNNSQDNKQDLENFAYNKQIPILPSGFDLATKWNSHGEVLRKFVQEHPLCTYYLFLDADICFLEENTLPAMVQELQQDETAFGIFPRITSNAQTEIGEDFWPIVYNTRLHPCCALVRNTDLFRNVVEEVGFSCINYLWA